MEDFNLHNTFFECMGELVSNLTDGSELPMEFVGKHDSIETGVKRMKANFDILINKIKGFRIMGKEVRYVQQLVPHCTYVVKVDEVKDQNTLQYLSTIAENLQVNFILFDKRMDVVSCPPGYRIVSEKVGPKIIGS
jgi:hypothetical protein